MRMPQEICVDAGLAIKLVVIEPDSQQAEALFSEWQSSGCRLIAPAFFEVETSSILRQKVVLRNELTSDEATLAFRKLHALPIQKRTVRGQRQRAWDIATEFGFPTLYDATYLALAALCGCEFWTADRRLFNQVKGRLPFVHLLENFQPE